MVKNIKSNFTTKIIGSSYYYQFVLHVATLYMPLKMKAIYISHIENFLSTRKKVTLYFT